MFRKPGHLFINLLVVGLLNASASLAQHRTGYIEFSVGTGNIIHNYPEFPVTEKPAFVASLKYSQHFNGYKPWHRYYNYPIAGINLTGGSIGNNAILGHFAGLMADFSFEKKLGKNFFWAPRLALGTSWFSKPYDEFTNPENVVIGSTFTFLASAELAAGYHLNSNIDLLLKGSIIHASNSHFKLPNVGMNLPVLLIGARYHFISSAEEQPDTTRIEYNRKCQLHIRFALGVNEQGSSTTPVNGSKYPIYLGSIYVSKLFSPVNKVSAGIETWYNKGVYDYIVSQDFYETDRYKKSMAVAMVFGHEFLMGHIGVITTLGVYIYNPFYKDRLERNEITDFKDKLKSIIPARLGFQYYLKNTCFEQNRNLFVGLYIKSNFGQADFLESGIGYMF